MTCQWDFCLSSICQTTTKDRTPAQRKKLLVIIFRNFVIIITMCSVKFSTTEYVMSISTVIVWSMNIAWMHIRCSLLVCMLCHMYDLSITFHFEKFWQWYVTQVASLMSVLLLWPAFEQLFILLHIHILFGNKYDDDDDDVLTSTDIEDTTRKGVCACFT